VRQDRELSLAERVAKLPPDERAAIAAPKIAQRPTLLNNASGGAYGEH
jgi:hypothetical protein